MSSLGRGRPVDRITAIVARYLDEFILPCVYAEARALIAAHREAGREVIATERGWPILEFTSHAPGQASRRGESPVKGHATR